MKPFMSRKLRNEINLTPKKLIALPLVILFGSIETIGTIMVDISKDINLVIMEWSK